MQMEILLIKIGVILNSTVSEGYEGYAGSHSIFTAHTGRQHQRRQNTLQGDDPTIIVVKIFQEMGGVVWFSDFIAPVMGAVGLPPEMGLVWATAIFVNIYSGLVVLINTDVTMTVAQASILSCMMLVAHSMPVEVGLAKKSGVSIWWAVFSRIAGAMFFGWILYHFFNATGSLQQTAHIIWQPSGEGNNASALGRSANCRIW